MDYHLEKEEIRSAIQNSSFLDYSFDFISAQDTSFITELLNEILKVHSLSEISSELQYILMELITNANKAHVKKIYFLQNDSDLTDFAAYKKLSSDFSQIIQSGFESFVPLFKRYNLNTRIRFEFTEKLIWIKVINNRAATLQETQRIQKILEGARKIRNTIEAFEKMTDKEEGANLGTLTSILILRRLGLSMEDYIFEVDREKNETCVSLRIRLDTITKVEANKIADVIAASIESLPGFPENIIRLHKMMSEENIAFSRLAEVFQSDPALTADLLKIVNSAQYMLPQKVSNIQNALSLIGIRGIKNLLYSFGTQNVLEKNFGKFEELWMHSYQAASYAYNLAKHLKLNNIMDDVYLGAVLHDMGKIMVYHLSPGLLPAINEHCGGRLKETDFLETLAIGVPHSLIGAEIAMKWNFPDFLVEIIRYHHSPLLAPDEFQEKASIVHLANKLAQLSRGTSSYDTIHDDVLDFLKISRNNLNELEKKLLLLYKIQKEKVSELDH